MNPGFTAICAAKVRTTQSLASLAHLPAPDSPNNMNLKLFKMNLKYASNCLAGQV